MLEGEGMQIALHSLSLQREAHRELAQQLVVAEKVDARIEGSNRDVGR